MNHTELTKILTEHREWLESDGERGARADLCGADLSCADLRGADLRRADLSCADLPDGSFVIMGERYEIIIANGEYVRAGCQNYTAEEWRQFSRQEIGGMDIDGRSALRFYPRLLDIIDFYLGAGERPEWLRDNNTEARSNGE